MRLTPFRVATVLGGAAAQPVAASIVQYQFQGSCRSGACSSFGAEITGSLSLNDTGSGAGAPIPTDALVAFGYSLDGVAQLQVVYAKVGGSSALSDGQTQITYFGSNALSTAVGTFLTLTTNGQGVLTGQIQHNQGSCPDPACWGIDPVSDPATYSVAVISGPGPQPAALPLLAGAGVGLTADERTAGRHGKDAAYGRGRA